MPRLQVEELAIMLDSPDTVRINVLILLLVLSDGIVRPTAFPKSTASSDNHLVKDAFGIRTYLYSTLKYSSACSYLSSCSIGLSNPIALNAAFFQLVTIFHPNRPPVR